MGIIIAAYAAQNTLSGLGTQTAATLSKVKALYLRQLSFDFHNFGIARKLEVP